MPGFLSSIMPSTVPSPANPLQRMFMPGAASTNPFTGGVSYKPEQLQDPTDLRAALAHENVHAQNLQQMGALQRIGNMLGMIHSNMTSTPQELAPGSILNKGYYWNPEELQAFQAQKDILRNTNRPDPMTGRGDIQLQRELPISQRQKILSMFKGPN